MSATVCVVPARGGSKRVPNKNIRDLAGQPLLGYTLDTALEADVFDRIIVSSGDEEILKFARESGVDTDNRPKELRGDTVRTVEVLEDLINRPRIHDRFDNVAQMLPTCPFRKSVDVQNAYDLFVQKGEEMPVVSVTKYDFSPMHALRWADDTNMIAIREPEAYADTTRTQDIPDLYHPNGAIYFTPIQHLSKHGEFFVEPLAGSLMPPERSIDIDLPHEFEIANLYMEHLKGGGGR